MSSSDKPTIPLDTTLVISSEQVSTDVSGEAVILSLKDGTYYGLNPVGARIWELLQEPRTMRDVRDTLLDEYDVAEERCTRELAALVKQFQDWGLVTLQKSSTGA